MKSEIINHFLENGYNEINPNVFEKTVTEFNTVSINGNTKQIPSQKVFTFKLEDGGWIGNSEEDSVPLIQIVFSFNKIEQDTLLVKSLEDFKKFITI
jgi:hypothetical protein